MSQALHRFVCILSFKRGPGKPLCSLPTERLMEATGTVSFLFLLWRPGEVAGRERGALLTPEYNPVPVFSKSGAETGSANTHTRTHTTFQKE